MQALKGQSCRVSTSRLKANGTIGDVPRYCTMHERPLLAYSVEKLENILT